MARISYLKVCEGCPRMFLCSDNRKRFCSQQCFGNFKRTLTEIPCKECGKPFRPPSSRERLCSRACLHSWQSRLFAKDNVVLNCQHCGKEYERKPSLRNISKFCSRKCQGVVTREKQRQARLRNGGTLPERLTRTALEELGVAFLPEHKIASYTVDFFLPDRNIALEVDGVYWHSMHPEKDAIRDSIIHATGVRVVRITDKQIIKSPDLCELLGNALSD